MRAASLLDDPSRSAPALVELDADHPGFHDPEYRRRRNEIAHAATSFREGDPVPRIEYTHEEHEVWREVWRSLDPLHQKYACREYLEASRTIALSREAIPQLADVNLRIGPKFGFRMLPVGGLVTARSFLVELARGVFLSTQYMRHHSVPLYTPEPDVVHELIGHAATFVHPQFARLNRAFGEAALRAADDATIEQIGRLYWFTLEFGLVLEGTDVKVCGAGLLSSFGELGRFEREEELLPWDVDRIARTEYDPTHYQETLFIAPSFASMTSDIVDWLARI